MFILESVSSSIDSLGVSSEDEDDSILELFVFKFRSFSFGKFKRYRSRSSGLVRFFGFVLRFLFRERRGISRSFSS